jgi:hypothetical protein
MPRRLAPAAIVVVLLVSACGGGHGKRRDAVSTYYKQVDAVQIALRTPLLAVEKAYRDFGRKKGPTLTQIEPRLVRAEATMRKVGKRLEALRPPPDAQKLHSMIVRLVNDESEIAHEVVLLAQFSPRFSTALGPLRPASVKLRAAFKSAKKATEQAAALDTYSVALAGVLQKLRFLHAPPAFVPTLETQQATLARVRTTAVELAVGLRSKRRAVLPALIQRFTNAGLASQGLAAQKARIAAIKAYNTRVSNLSVLGHQIDLERVRLQKVLG